MNWNRIPVGVVLKQFKTNWYKDPIINVIDNDMVHVLKRLRIGNSKLRRHCKRGDLKICVNCGDNKIENIQHYLLECEKFTNQRTYMINKVEPLLNEMNKKLDVKHLLGFFPELYRSKVKTKQYFNQIFVILHEVVDFIKKSQRFSL